MLSATSVKVGFYTLVHIYSTIKDLCMRLTYLKMYEMQSVGNRVGVSEPFLMRMAHGAPMRTVGRSREHTKGSHGKLQKQPGISNNHALPEEKAFRVCKRFYVALILARLVQV